MNASSTLLRAVDAVLGNRVQLFVRRRWMLSPGGLSDSSPAALQSTTIDACGVDISPRRVRTDVTVSGSAYAPPRKEGATQFRCGISVGASSYDAVVLGRRQVSWSSRGNPVIGPPAPVEKVSLDAAFAYGGFDPHGLVGVSAERLDEVGWNLVLSPAFYPRNLRGLGYAIAPGRDFEMPQLENPEHLLTSDSLLVAPDAWDRAPTPRHFGAVLPCEFPRTLLACDEAARGIPRPPPEELEEVQQGWLAGVDFAHEAMDAFGISSRFFQEAPPGLQLPFLCPGTPVALENMHREHARLKFEVPAPPHVEVRFRGSLVEHGPLVIHRMVVAPDEGEVTLTYFCEAELPHHIAPRIQPDVPLVALVEGERVLYAPPTEIAQTQDPWRSLTS